MLDAHSPFHSGELAAQQRAGAFDTAIHAAPFIRDYMPDQHRAFYAAQPFLVAASSDGQGRVWTTILEGPDGFVRSPDPQTLTLSTDIDPADPLANALEQGTDIGVVGIELATRRRNRFSGRTRKTDDGLAIDIRQTFGNCPQYISERDWWRVPPTSPVAAKSSDALDSDQIARIQAADTLFIGSGHKGGQGAASDGFDASHRGGEAGFIQVMSPTHLRIPDYAGNNFFNTIGNLMEDPRVGLLFVDFATGGLLHVTGRAEIDWAPQDAQDPGVLRVIDVTIDAVIDRREALSLRWSEQPAPSVPLVVTDKVAEADGLTSFYLEPVGGASLQPFEAGQHLPIALAIPGQDVKTRRSYSLSGDPKDARYRITVKREPKGLASRFLHDWIDIGHVIEARPPSGDFVAPSGDAPLVLVSAGVGLTPMVSIMHQIASEQSDRPVWFVHGARNGHLHAMREEVAQLASGNPNLQQRVFYSTPDAGDVAGRDFDVEGRITARDLLDLKLGDHADFMMCGPAGFVADIKAGLEAAGVSPDQIHFETFGS